MTNEDGANFCALRAPFWAHTDEAKISWKEVLDRPGEFHATYRDGDLIFHNSRVAPQVSPYLPMRDFMEGF
ncbi:g8749 [Coccomyxa elongata]